jgi:uncharacterized protein YkwD
LSKNKTFYAPLGKSKHHKSNKHHSKKHKNPHWVDHVGHIPDHLHDARGSSDEYKRRKRIKWLIILGIILLLLGALAIAYILTPTVTDEIQYEYVNITEDEVVTLQVSEEVPAEVSLAQYLETPETYANQPADVLAHLKHGVKIMSGNAGVYTELATDNENDIELIGLSGTQKALFKEKSTSEELYAITGTFRNHEDGFKIDVDEIEEREQATKTVTRTVQKKEPVTRTIKQPVENNAEEDNIIFTIIAPIKRAIQGICKDGTTKESCSGTQPFYCNMAGMLTENPEECGCPEGEREYKSSCIPIVECRDGTLEPECSDDKPYKCEKGKLTEKASVCGCPEDYRRIRDSCEEILRCHDGTEYGHCAKNKPMYCDDGRLLTRSSECGCPSGQVRDGEQCMERAKKEAMEALEYVNRLRAENSRDALQWNDDLYDLGMFRAKDMYTRNYFDHVDPDGKCANSYKSQYSLGQYTLAENAGAVYEGYTDYDMHYASYANPSKQVDGWMESRGHRYNLLYEPHKIGIVACYKGACVFLGGHTQAYGLGAGPCATGEEGQAYWDSVGKQPGEV